MNSYAEPVSRVATSQDGLNFVSASIQVHVQIEPTLFPAFRRLERDGEIAAEWQTTENGRRAKYYALSPRGRQTLARTTKEWQRQTAAISRVLKASLGEL